MLLKIKADRFDLIASNVVNRCFNFAKLKSHPMGWLQMLPPVFRSVSVKN